MIYYSLTEKVKKFLKCTDSKLSIGDAFVYAKTVLAKICGCDKFPQSPAIKPCYQTTLVRVSTCFKTIIGQLNMFEGEQ